MSGFEELLNEVRRCASTVDEAMLRLLEAEGHEAVLELYRASRHLIEAGGKRLRPFLVLKSCEAVGGEEEEALPAATAVELLHTFTLIHDDIMDRDDVRRGVPTVHVKWGLDTAIMAGDLLFAKVFQSVAGGVSRGRAERMLRVVKLLAEAAVEICEGQAMDMAFEVSETVSEEAYITMVSKKTAALMRASAMCGGVCGGGGEVEVDALGRYGLNAGIAFQIVDDVLGVVADERTLGKPVGSDLREGKKTIVVIHALNNAPEDLRRRIASVLGRRDASKEEIQEALEAVKEAGSVGYAKRLAVEYADRAKQALNVLPETRARKLLTDLVDFFVARTY
ncbi:MAG TPA: polyprenyl synthetase family protein [Candidatus Bathyarchaeota archaeon]|nr:polyprenyl synthetase family protein [Candidatus Bathyarchaeota archaeon]